MNQYEIYQRIKAGRPDRLKLASLTGKKKDEFERQLCPLYYGLKERADDDSLEPVYQRGNKK